MFLQKSPKFEEYQKIINEIVLSGEISSPFTSCDEFNPYVKLTSPVKYYHIFTFLKNIGISSDEIFFDSADDWQLFIEAGNIHLIGTLAFHYIIQQNNMRAVEIIAMALATNHRDDKLEELQLILEDYTGISYGAI